MYVCMYVQYVVTGDGADDDAFLKLFLNHTTEATALDYPTNASKESYLTQLY